MRKPVSPGGDADTLAFMTGGIARAYYKVIPDNIITEARKRLPDDLLSVVNEFQARFPCPRQPPIHIRGVDRHHQLAALWNVTIISRETAGCYRDVLPPSLT